MQPANVQQSVDINTIPRALLESVEVITGGASAVYGSDAIAGVVNFHLKDNYQGLALDAQYNITDKADGMVKDLSALWGTNFGGGRGNVVVALGYSARDTVRFNSREFFRRNQGGTDLRIPSGVYTSSGNAPANRQSMRPLLNMAMRPAPWRPIPVSASRVTTVICSTTVAERSIISMYS
jgi:outer membrane receptor protein involved in Fe transport